MICLTKLLLGSFVLKIFFIGSQVGYYRGSHATPQKVIIPSLELVADVAIVLMNILHREMLGGYSHGHPHTIMRVSYFLYNQVKERNGNMQALFCGKLISTVFSVSQGRSRFPHLLGICE